MSVSNDLIEKILEVSRVAVLSKLKVILCYLQINIKVSFNQYPPREVPLPPVQKKKY